MANLTLSLDDNLLLSVRNYAKSQGISLNALVKQLLIKTVKTSSKVWLQECFDLMDKAHADSQGKKWKREDLYDA